MGIKLSDLHKATHKIEVRFRGEAVELEYYVNIVTPAFLREENSPSEQLAKMLKRWDIQDEDGQEIPVSIEVIDTLPYSLQGELSRAIIKDMQGPGEEEKKG